MITRNDQYAIWWLSEGCCELIKPHLLSMLPKYIQDEFVSLWARAGRGRLWSAKGIELKHIDWNYKSPLALSAEKCGGIVVHAYDAIKLVSLPGFVTDVNLMPWDVTLPVMVIEVLKYDSL